MASVIILKTCVQTKRFSHQLLSYSRCMRRFHSCLKADKKMRVNINRFGWNCLKTLETFVWISNHVSRSTTWSPFNLKLDQNDQSKYDVSCGGVILTPSSSQHNFELAYNVLTKLSYCPSFQFLAIFFSVSNFCPIFLNCYLLVIKSFLSCVPVT